MDIKRMRRRNKFEKGLFSISSTLAHSHLERTAKEKNKMAINKHLALLATAASTTLAAPPTLKVTVAVLHRAAFGAGRQTW